MDQQQDKKTENSENQDETNRKVNEIVSDDPFTMLHTLEWNLAESGKQRIHNKLRNILNRVKNQLNLSDDDFTTNNETEDKTTGQWTGGASSWIDSPLDNIKEQMARTRDDFSRALSRLKSADDKYKMMDVFTWFTRSLLARHPWLDDEKESSNQEPVTPMDRILHTVKLNGGRCNESVRQVVKELLFVCGIEREQTHSVDLDWKTDFLHRQKTQDKLKKGDDVSQAMAMLDELLEQAIKFTHKPREKEVLIAGRKQHQDVMEWLVEEEYEVEGYKSDITELQQRITQLQRKVDSLGEENNALRKQLQGKEFKAAAKSETEALNKTMTQVLSNCLDVDIKNKFQTQFKSVISELGELRVKYTDTECRLNNLLDDITHMEEEMKSQDTKLAHVINDLKNVNLRHFLETGLLVRKDGKPLSEKAKVFLVRLKKSVDDRLAQEKEKNRKQLQKIEEKHNADEWDLEKSHREEMLHIYKHCSQLFEHINSFKTRVSTILAKAELKNASEQVRAIKNIAAENGSLSMGDKMRAAKDVLSCLDTHLTSAMNDKSRVESMESLKQQLQASEKARQECEESTEKLKWKLSQAEAAFNINKSNKDSRGMLERYRKLVYQNACLQKTITQIESEMQYKLKENSHSLNVAASEKASLSRVIEEQKNSIANMQKMSKTKQKFEEENLKFNVCEARQALDLLENFLVNDSISPKIYAMTADLMLHSIDLTELKLKSLFKRYIKLNRLHDAKEHLLDQLEEKIHVSRKQRITLIVHNMDKKLNQLTRKRRREILELEQQFQAFFLNVNKALKAVVFQDELTNMLPSEEGTLTSVTPPTEGTISSALKQEVSKDRQTPSPATGKKCLKIKSVPVVSTSATHCARKSPVLTPLHGMSMLHQCHDLINKSMMTTWTADAGTEWFKVDKMTLNQPKQQDKASGVKVAESMSKAISGSYDCSINSLRPTSQGLSSDQGYVYITKDAMRPKQYTTHFDPNETTSTSSTANETTPTKTKSPTTTTLSTSRIKRIISGKGARKLDGCVVGKKIDRGKQLSISAGNVKEQ